MKIMECFVVSLSVEHFLLPCIIYCLEHEETISAHLHFCINCLCLKYNFLKTIDVISIGKFGQISFNIFQTIEQR